MNRRSFFRGVVAAISGLVGTVYGLGRPRVGPDGLTKEDVEPDPLWRDPSGKGRTYGTGVDPAPLFEELRIVALSPRVVNSVTLHYVDVL